LICGRQKNLSLGRNGCDCPQRFAERADKPSNHFSYRTHIKEKSLYHTPPTFAIYIVGLMTEWIELHGGLAGIQKRNEAKAKLLYDTIDSSSGFYHCPVERDSRSLMNVVFRVAGRNGQSAAIKPDSAEGIRQGSRRGAGRTPGHRSVRHAFPFIMRAGGRQQ
jgi:phosphoserine aminotransferase